MTTAYGSITVSGLTDIADIYFEYALAVDSANVTNSYPFNQTGELGWTVNGESRKIPPTWESGYKVWVREVKVKTDIVTKIYGNPYPDTAINQTNVDLTTLQTKVKKIWSNSSGSYMASGIGNNDVDTATVSTYGFNSRTTTGGISFNYNAIPLTELGTSGLKLYIPTISNNTITSSNLGVELTTSALKFYDPTYHKAAMVLTGSSLTFNKLNTTTAAATLNSTGLNITSGSIALGSNFTVTSTGALTATGVDIKGIIKADTGYIGGASGWTIASQQLSSGIIGQDNSVFLATKNLAGTINSVTLPPTVEGVTATEPGWRLTIGSQFGVDSTGKLYASGAEISGKVTITDSNNSNVYTKGETDDEINSATTDMATNTEIASAYSTKSNTIVQTQRIYIQTDQDSPPNTPGNIWITDETGLVNDVWSCKRMPYSRDYPYIWTCEQRLMDDGLYNYTPVLLDETTTIIDGGHIITNSITTDQIDAGAITTDKLNIGEYISFDYDSNDLPILTLGGSNTLKTEIRNGKISFIEDGSEIAYIEGKKLYITQSVVLQQMDIGETVALNGKGQWSWKIHDVNGENNLYLKWLG